MTHQRRRLYQAASSSRLYEEIVQQIEDRIASGELKVGDRLPSQRQLAEEMDVSHVAVKEALRTLAAKGLVQVRQGSGTYVTDSAIIAMSDIMRLFIDGDSFLDLIAARGWIESDVVRLAATHATTEDLAAMRAALCAMEEEVAATGVFSETNLRFHRVLARASHNAVYRIISELLLHMVSHYAEPRYRGFSPKGYGHGLEVHRHILEAIEARDPERAFEVMQEHWQASRDLLAMAQPKNFVSSD